VGGGRGVGPCAGGVDGEGAVAAHGAGLRTKVAGESTSEMFSVPLVEMSAARLVSVRLAVADGEDRRASWCQDIDGDRL